jgi:hypothetical protein
MDVKAAYREAFGEEVAENLAAWEQSLFALETRRLLAELGVPVIREELGGSCGRTLTFEAATGALDIRTFAPMEGSRL